MDGHKTQLLETLAILVLYVIAYFITKTTINNALKNTQLQRTRRKMIIKAVHFFTTITVVILIAGVWGMQQNEIAVFASTILTAIGIAFFAQWSLLSNVTSSIMLFFNHPMKLGDTIKVMDKDCPFEGEVTELTYFFVHIKTTSGETITIPNSLLFQKSISVIEKNTGK
jgi:small-conductance mechanosensitive channel